MQKLLLRYAATLMLIALGHSPIQAQTSAYASADAGLSAATELLDDGGIDTADSEALREIRKILDQIIEDFPASDIAVKILFQDTIGNLDVAQLDKLLLESSDPNDGSTEVTSPMFPKNIEVDSAPTETQDDASLLPDGEEVNAPLSIAEFAVVEPLTIGSEFDPTGFQVEIRELAGELHMCYIRGQLEGGTETQTIKFTVAKNGQLDGVPEVENSDGLSGAGRKTYLNALIAIEICGPYPPRYSDSSYEAVFDGAGLTQLIDLSTLEEPWKPTDQSSLTALKLSRKSIAEIQARLDISGFDPNGIDGVMGKGSRSAVAAWQRSQDIPNTGFLNLRQLERLNELTETFFSIWLLNPDNKAILDKAGRPPARSTSSRRTIWYRDSAGRYCKRVLLGTWCQTARPRN